MVWHKQKASNRINKRIYSTFRNYQLWYLCSPVAGIRSLNCAYLNLNESNQSLWSSNSISDVFSFNFVTMMCRSDFKIGILMMPIRGVANAKSINLCKSIVFPHSSI